MSNHTPGPWSFRPDDPDDPSCAYVRSENADGEMVAKVFRQSDAQLIAAAPDLLAACIRLVSAFSPDVYRMVAAQRGSAEASDVAHAAGLAAIAKAKGGQQ